ncbi:MAG: hypothetical protein ABL998_17000, partial [Planctomycetota bacterium]
TRATRKLLVGGCALVLALELPSAWRAFFAGWRGPYAPAAEEDTLTARFSGEVARLAGLLLLVRP